jgi:rubredoxin
VSEKDYPQHCGTCDKNYLTCGHNKGAPRKVHPGSFCRTGWVKKGSPKCGRCGSYSFDNQDGVLVCRMCGLTFASSYQAFNGEKV